MYTRMFTMAPSSTQDADESGIGLEPAFPSGSLREIIEVGPTPETAS